MTKHQRAQRLPQPTDRQRLGARGEAMAADALRAAGYEIVAADVRTKSGQIDLIARQGDDLVFVEVKTRRGVAFGTPAEAVTAAKRHHLLTAAQEYLADHDALDHTWRIDVVAILLTNGAPQIEIIPYAVGEG